MNPTNTPPENVTARGVFSLLMSMFGTRLELAAIDVEAHVQSTLVALMTAFVAIVLALVAFAFVGIAVVVLFWDTHRVAAAASVTGGYVALAAFMALRASALWNGRPAAFAATMQQFELDAQAFRGRPSRGRQ
jgi:uncharacterized membrane protein YqjE